MSPADPTEGLTIRDLVMEVRTNVSRLHDDLNAFKSQVVLRSEYQKDRDYARSVRRWSVTILVSIAGVGVAAVSVVLSNLS